MFRILPSCVALLLLFLSVARAQPNPTPNLVSDGGFEHGAVGWSWHNSGADATGGVDRTEKHSSNFSYKLTNKSSFAPNRYARIFQFVSGLRPYTKYRISCWAKAKAGGITWIGGGPGWYDRHPFPKGDFDWQLFSFELDSGAVPDNYELMVVTESETEALWIDDIRFEPIAVEQAKQDALYADLNAQVERLRQRLRTITAQAGGEAKLAGKPYLRLGVTVANRFIEFVQRGGPDGRSGLAWSKLQCEEVAQVLDETEGLLRSGPSALLDWQPPKPGRVTRKEGTFYQGRRPFYFAGYGHFDSVINDLPDFRALGASLIQDGRAGPSAMNPDGTLGEGALAVLRGLDRAASFGLRVDFLLSPHYYPDWARAPDFANGNIGFLAFNIFHPKAQATFDQWIALMGARLKEKPALHSVCLANEPVYISSGRDRYTRPAFSDYLKRKHQTIAALNALYGTSYQSFDEVAVPAPAMPAAVPAQRAYYDWTCFNKQMFADWHAALAARLKQHGVKAPTHTKIMVFQSLDRDKLAYGVDPELMCDATDLAGCDAYAFPGGAYAYDWFGQEFFYDLLHSFRGQPVFNSENHLIPDNSPPVHIPPNHSRTAIWQGGLHHQASTTIWVWEKAGDPSLAGSIYFRPGNVYGAGRAMLDLNRLAPEVAAINSTPPTVALLYSQPSIFWEPKYQPTIYSLYTALTFLAQNVTFVSERQLAQGRAAKVPWLLVPNATRVLPETPAALARFQKTGSKVLLVGKDCLLRDEYDRSLNQATTNFPVIELANSDPDPAALLRRALATLVFYELRDAATSQPAWGVEYRVVSHARTTLVPVVNLNQQTKSLQFPAWSHRSATDLLSGEPVDLSSFQAEPMVPRLLQLR
jgi:hypothetical protein